VKERLASMPVIGTALAVQERYKADAADPLAAAIGFFGFLSLFPLLLLAVSVAGFVVDDPADQVAIAERITEAIPGFEQTVDDEEGGGVQELVSGVVEQRGTIGLIGGVVLLLSGLRVVNGAMMASRVVFRGEVLKGVGAKVRQLLALVALGLLALGGVVASSVAGSGLGELPALLALLLSVAVTFVLDVLLFLGAYVLLAPTATLSARERLPGALLGAAGWTLLKVAGASYVGNQVDSANALYGALGGVIALLLLLYLGGRLYLYGAELSAVRYERVHGPLVPPHERDAGGDDVIVGEPDGTRADDDGPPPVPRAAWLLPATDPGPAGASPTVGPGTRERLAAAGVRDAAEHAPAEPGRDVRTAAAFVLAVGALAAGWRFLGDRRG